MDKYTGQGVRDLNHLGRKQRLLDKLNIEIDQLETDAATFDVVIEHTVRQNDRAIRLLRDEANELRTRAQIKRQEVLKLQGKV